MQENLKPREQEIFDLLLEEISPKEIAYRLNVSYSTVDHYRTKIYRKLGVRNIHELLEKYSHNENNINTVETDNCETDTTKAKTPLSINRTKMAFIILFSVILFGIFIFLLWNFISKASVQVSSSGTNNNIENTDEFGFVIYDDYLSEGFSIQLFSEHSIINYYSTPAAQGVYAIHWSNISKHHGIKFWFPTRDLSYHVQNDYVLEFKAKTSTPVHFDIKFFNLEDGINWLIGTRFEHKLLPDGTWQTFRLPLKEMYLFSGLSETEILWHPIQGKQISWENIFALEFYATLGNGTVQEIYLDDIKVTK